MSAVVSVAVAATASIGFIGLFPPHFSSFNCFLTHGGCRGSTERERERGKVQEK